MSCISFINPCSPYILLLFFPCLFLYKFYKYGYSYIDTCFIIICK